MDVSTDQVAEHPSDTSGAAAVPPPAAVATAAHDTFDVDSEVPAPLCPRCLVDLSRLNVMARFCPRCGEQLMAGFGPVSPEQLAAEHKHAVPRPRPMLAPPGWPAPVPATPILPEPPPSPPPRTPAQLAVEVQRLAAEWLRLAERAATAAGDDVSAHSLMLQAYSNAMYRLGWRYESAAGGHRNADEAIRCYFKAARLGNADALARLTPRCAGEAPVTKEPRTQ
jgi:hypothetical protein